MVTQKIVEDLSEKIFRFMYASLKELESFSREEEDFLMAIASVASMVIKVESASDKGNAIAMSVMAQATVMLMGYVAANMIKAPIREAIDGLDEMFMSSYRPILLELEPKVLKARKEILKKSN